MANERHEAFVERYFQYKQLPERLQNISVPFRVLADGMLGQPCNDDAELMAGLRKLLEAKDCAVRAAL